MSVIDKLISWLAPHECLGCGTEDTLLCEGCAQNLPKAVIPLAGYDHLSTVRAYTLYQGVAKDLIWKLKSNGARAAAGTMAEYMSRLVSRAPLLIVPVPTATSRARQRGYDQAKLLARNLSVITRLPYVNCLRRQGRTHQVGAARQQRLTQLAEAFTVYNTARIRGAHILLVDDVTTTGATLESAAIALKRMGASRVEALTFAYAEKLS